MNTTSRIRTHRSKAQGLVEFALVLPVLLTLLMGSIDLGWLLFNYVQLNNGLREGLRYGSVPSFSGTDQYVDCRGIYDRIENLANMVGVKDSDITIYYDKGYSASSGDASNIVGTCSLPGPYAGALNNGNRIVIEMKPYVKLLTPFFSTFAPGGVQFIYRGSRTLFPGGVIVQ